MNLTYWIKSFWANPAEAAASARVAWWKNRTPSFWRALRGKYAGYRGFVIGNGPSLQMNDLSRLSDEITIASNKIYLAFPGTSWRPTLYTVADSLVWPKVAGELHGRVPCVIIPSSFDASLSSVPVRTFHYSAYVDRDVSDCDEPMFSSNIFKGLFSSQTVTFDNLQIAVFLGLDPIYLIGCDHYYEGEKDIRPGVPVESVADNHFIKGYRQKGEQVNPAPIREMTRGYEHAQAWAKRNNRRILNATRGGHLEVFERVELDSLLDS